jgi:hypothetical protein
MGTPHSELMHEVNERTYTVLIDLGSEDGDFVCECDETACFETIKITLREYAARPQGQPLLAPGHEKLVPSVS